MLDRVHDLLHHLILFDYESACLDHLYVLFEGVLNADCDHQRLIYGADLSLIWFVLGLVSCLEEAKLRFKY